MQACLYCFVSSRGMHHWRNKSQNAANILCFIKKYWNKLSLCSFFSYVSFKKVFSYVKFSHWITVKGHYFHITLTTLNEGGKKICCLSYTKKFWGKKIFSSELNLGNNLNTFNLDRHRNTSLLCDKMRETDLPGQVSALIDFMFRITFICTSYGGQLSDERNVKNGIW